MQKILAILVAVGIAFGLAACNSENKDAQKDAQVAAPVVATMPSDPNDTAAWKKYLVTVVTQNMQGVKTNRPYMYFVPGGDDDKSKADRANQLDNVSTTVSRGVLPGNMMAFGGPNSGVTADLIAEAFKSPQQGSFKDVVVLFVGAPADQERVKAALATSGATFRFVELK